jgi:hypothetical protein
MGKGYVRVRVNVHASAVRPSMTKDLKDGFERSTGEIAPDRAEDSAHYARLQNEAFGVRPEF